MTSTTTHPRGHGMFALLAIMLAFACGCAEATDADRMALRSGYESYITHNYTAAQSAADGYIQKFPKDPHLDEALYLRGLTRLADGNRIGAKDDLEAAVARTRRQDLKGKALKALGDMAYERQDFQTAIVDYQAAAIALPSIGQTGETNLRLGASLQAVGRWDEARVPLSKAASESAGTLIGQRAGERLQATSFNLQFGAFRAQQLAFGYVRGVLATGVPVKAVPVKREGQVLFLVRSGDYHTYAEAAAARDKLIARYPLVTIVP